MALDGGVFLLVFQMSTGCDFFLHVHMPQSLWALYPRRARLLAYWHEKMWVLDPRFMPPYCRLDMFGGRWTMVPSWGHSRSTPPGSSSALGGKHRGWPCLRPLLPHASTKSERPQDTVVCVWSSSMLVAASCCIWGLGFLYLAMIPCGNLLTVAPKMSKRLILIAEICWGNDPLVIKHGSMAVENPP